VGRLVFASGCFEAQILVSVSLTIFVSCRQWEAERPMLLAVALSSGFPLPTKIVKEGILFPSSAALLAGRFFRLGSAKTNKAGPVK
jgi:hypothetical protein